MRIPGRTPFFNAKPQFRFGSGSVSLFLLLLAAACAPANAQTPTKGRPATDFTLSTITGTPQLSAETSKGTTVLVILRGYPGYQCPFCQKQAHDFIAHASDFAKKKASVILGGSAVGKCFRINSALHVGA